MRLGGKRVEVSHFGRAHTDGDVVAYFPDHRVVAMGDMFQDRIDGAKARLSKGVDDKGLGDKYQVKDDRCFTGFDAYKKVLALDDVDLVIEVIPSVVGVAEAADIMGWDKRRVITYIDRGSFPEPLTTLASGRIWLREDVEELRHHLTAERFGFDGRQNDRHAVLLGTLRQHQYVVEQQLAVNAARDERCGDSV
mgnify:CR=1 FL=1